MKIADNLELPTNSVTKTFAIIAQRRKGKTYTANVMAEEMVVADIPWVALDPTGAWWGLRSSVDGKKPGLPVYVFGGDHGDLPLERGAGKMIADLVVNHPAWYILDFSHFESKAAERELATDFAERFYRRKGTNKTPVHLFVDEADMFAPQRIPSGDQRMLGAFESIVRRGGIRGIGTTLITQRAAVLNKNVLEQIDVLIALRTVGPNDRKAIDGYVEANATPEQRAELMGSIASLELGEAWVWEPGEDLFSRVHIRKRHTFNSSATPDSNEPAEIAILAPVDLDKIRGQMADTIERVKADDPKELHARIIELEQQVHRPEIVEKIVEQRVEVPILTDGQIATLTETAESVLEAAQEILDKIGPYMEPRAIQQAKPPTQQPKMLEPAIKQDEFTLNQAQRRFLEVLDYFPEGMTKIELGFAAGYGQGGYFNRTLSGLRTQGYVTESGNKVLATPGGLELLGDSRAKPLLGEALRDYWRGKLNQAQAAVFDVVTEDYPRSVPLDILSERTGYGRGGYFNRTVSRLRTMGILEGKGEVRAVDELFLQETTRP